MFAKTTPVVFALVLSVLFLATQAQRTFITVSGTGFQNYVCSKGAFVGVGANANLSQNGRDVGNHFFEGGLPVFMINGGKVTLRKSGSTPAGPRNVPTLALSAVSSSGFLAGTKSGRRFNTSGGVAPTGKCTDGRNIRVPYRASYSFAK